MKKFLIIAVAFIVFVIVTIGCNNPGQRNESVTSPANNANSLSSLKDEEASTKPPAGWHDGPMVRAGLWAMERTDMITGPRNPGQAMNVYACDPRLKNATVTVLDSEINMQETHQLPEGGQYDCKEFKYTDVGFTTLAHLDGGFIVTIKFSTGKTQVFVGESSKYQVHSICVSYNQKGKLRAFANGPDVELKEQDAQ